MIKTIIMIITKIIIMMKMRMINENENDKREWQ